MLVRIPPVAPALLEDVMVTSIVESLVWSALFDRDSFAAAFSTPEESLTSHDEGLTGGVTLPAKGSSRHFLEGALSALPVGSEAHADLTAFLAALDKHGALLITLEH